MSVRNYAILYGGVRRVSSGASFAGGNAITSTPQHALDGPEHTGQLPTDRLSTTETDTALRLAPDGAGGVEWDVAAALTVKDEGTPLATAAASIDFVGAGVTASGTGAAKTVTIVGTTTAAVAAMGVVGPLLTSDNPSSPLVFADILQNETQTDFMYADLLGV